MRGLKHYVADRLGNTAKGAKDFVTEHPVGSAAIAGAGGVGLYHGVKKDPEDHPKYQQYR
jgi:ElaB/YqjD/DUF883 family membrane-anchored ribosome-binding protein